MSEHDRRSSSLPNRQRADSATAASSPRSPTSTLRRPSSPLSISRPSSPSSRGRSRVPVGVPVGTASPPLTARGPPSYARSSLDRSPSAHPMFLDDHLRVPPPIYLRSSSPGRQSASGQLKIHVPAWGVVLVRPPRPLELHPLENGSQAREPPSEDTVLSGTLEVIMKERRRCNSISVGVQSVCKLWFGSEKGWEEDGVFERGVEVLGGDADGIWLESGSQTFAFTLLLPATLATHDHHRWGRLSYILTARVEGIASTSHFGSLFSKKDSAHSPWQIESEIPFQEDFDLVISRSDKMAHERSDSRGSPFRGSPGERSPQHPPDSVLTVEGSPNLTGLYLRSQSSDIQRISSLNSAADNGSIHSVGSFGSETGQRSEKQGWLKGDLLASRGLFIHANPSSSGGVSQLDVRKEGYVEGLGSWRFSMTSDSFSISAVCIISLNVPSPAPKTTIFLVRVLLVQAYTLTSPRRPNEDPYRPEQAKTHVLYQVGKPAKTGKCPGYDVESLWRGPQIGGPGGGKGKDVIGKAGSVDPEVEIEGWKTRAVARVPNHDRIRPTTQYGTITPIRVSHELSLQVFYSVDRETVAGMEIEGPGELRMMTFKMPIEIPSCTLTVAALDLPTYETSNATPAADIDAVLRNSNSSKRCMCGASFAELGEVAMRKMQQQDQEEVEERMRGLRTGPSGGGLAMEREGSTKEEDERRSAMGSGFGSQGGGGSV